MLWLGFAERLDDFVTHGRDALAAHGLFWLAAAVTLITGSQYWEQTRKALKGA